MYLLSFKAIGQLGIKLSFGNEKNLFLAQVTMVTKVTTPK
jgi:hypothetical protein